MNAHREGLLNYYPELDGQPLATVFANQYAKYWRVHCAKPNNNPKKDIEYLGRYIKRPAIANSRLLHYSGTGFVFKYFNHSTKKTEYTQLHPFELITRFIEHIPEKGFRLIRYFGFLANRVRGKLLPLVHALFKTMNQTRKNIHGVIDYYGRPDKIHYPASCVKIPCISAFCFLVSPASSS